MKNKLTLLAIACLILNFGFVKAEVSQTTVAYLANQTQNNGSPWRFRPLVKIILI